MTEQLKIYIDRLKEGQIEQIAEVLPPDFLDIHEEDLAFSEPVTLSGKAYLAEDHLVLNLCVKTEASIPCCICNELVKVPVVLDNFYHTVALEDISSPVLDYGADLREAILLQTPLFAECSGGNCPEREEVSKYFKQNSPTANQKDGAVPTHFPFANLDGS